jgi:glycerol uptake facilitator-like aquaporin
MFAINALVFGLTYFAVMCATRHHGGAHLNPAITIACMLSGVTGALQAAVFIIVQACPPSDLSLPHMCSDVWPHCM